LLFADTSSPSGVTGSCISCGGAFRNFPLRSGRSSKLPGRQHRPVDVLLVSEVETGQ
jgi:hypothetical protein